MNRVTHEREVAAGTWQERSRRWGRRLWREWRLTLFLIVFVLVPVRSSLADWNWVPTGSMNPTILEGDLIFIDKAAYDLRVPLTMLRAARWSEPQRGDIVICLSPTDGTRLVKRIVAAPGDSVEMRDNVLFLNGRALEYHPAQPHYVEQLPDKLAQRCLCKMEDLDRISHPVLSIPGIRAIRDFGPTKIPEGQYFVLGDNRDISRDSRFFGSVPRRSILGKARAIILSVNMTEKYQPRLQRFLTALQ